MSESIEDRLERIERIMIEKCQDQFRILGAFWIIGGIFSTVILIAVGDDRMIPNPNDELINVVIFVVTGALFVSIGILIWMKFVWAVYVAGVLSFLLLLGQFGGESSPVAIVILIILIIKARGVIGWARQMRNMGLQFKKPTHPFMERTD